MKRIAAIVLLALCALACVGGLTGCAASKAAMYPDGEKYSVGDARIEEKVERLALDWTSGEVHIQTHAQSTVLIEEKVSSSVRDELRVHWWLDGTTLRVKFCASGQGLRPLGNVRKELTVTVPESVVLEQAEISAASADVTAEGLRAGELKASTASGAMSLNAEAERIDLSSASGDISLTQSGRAESIRVSSASGRQVARLSAVGEARFDAASGGIEVTAEAADSIRAETASGGVRLELAGMPAECSVRTTSGGVELRLPEDAGFTAQVETTSGDLESEYALKKSGETYICGDGSARIEIHTTSGDVSVQPRLSKGGTDR